MAASLNAHVYTYVRGRYKRGEIGAPARDAYLSTLLHLARIHGQRPPSQLGPATIDRWLEDIAQLAPSTRRNAVSRARNFGRWLQAEGVIKRDPTAHVPTVRIPHREPVTFTRAEVAALLAVLPDLRAKVIVALMDDTAARCADVALLRVEDCNLAERTVLLRAKGRERLNPISAATARLLAAYLAETGATHGPVVRAKDRPGGVLPSTVSKYVRAWMWQAGVKHRPGDHRSAHGLRRTCLSELMEASGDLHVVAEVAGHASVQTTVAHYLRRASVERKREALALRQAPAVAAA